MDASFPPKRHIQNVYTEFISIKWSKYESHKVTESEYWSVGRLPEVIYVNVLVLD